MHDELLQANARFYEVFIAADLPGLLSLWAEDDEVAVAHPGWPPLRGYGAVMSSWRDIFLAGTPDVVCEEPTAHMVGETAGMVICYERVGDTVLAATNLFKKVDGTWRMVLHQAGPVAAEALAQQIDVPDEDEYLN